MKQTINAKELRGLDACKSSYDRFYKVHGESTVSLIEFLDSNGMADVMWLIRQSTKELTQLQLFDLAALAIDLAEMVLPIYERESPNCQVPRRAIEAARACLEDPTEDKKQAAYTAAYRAGYEARTAANGAYETHAAASSAAEAAAEAAAGNEAAIVYTPELAAAAIPERKSEIQSKVKEMLKKWKGQ